MVDVIAPRIGETVYDPAYGSAGFLAQAFLANLPMFSEMDAAELDRIAAAAVPLYFEKGRSIVQQGDPCNGFHFVVYGQVKLERMAKELRPEWRTGARS